MLTTLVSVAELANHLRAPDWVIADCRFALGDPLKGRTQYEAGHIPDAVYAHLDDDLSSPTTPTTGRHPLPDPEQLARTFGRWGIDASKQVVAYDDSGGAFAARLWWLLKWLGHDRVAVLDGGYSAWLRAGHIVDYGEEVIIAAHFAPRLNASMSVTTGQLVSQGNDWQLIDAREGERFRGEVEPIDPVAGHVPGAINVPFKDNLTEDGHFRTADELRARFTPVVESAHAAGKSIASMCGSGVTACHNLLAMEVAGLKGAKLYGGSWSEWIRDPARPVAAGP